MQEKMAGKLKDGWERVQFYDAYCEICPKCTKYFTEGEKRKVLQDVIPMYRSEFKGRTDADNRS